MRLAERLVRRQALLRSAGCVMLAVALTALGACTPHAHLSPTGQRGPTPAEIEQMDGRAAQALASFTLAMHGVHTRPFLPVGEPFGQLGTWEPGNSANAGALASGNVRPPTAGPLTPPKTARVTWADGVTADVPAYSARTAPLAPGEPAQACTRGCPFVTLTGGTLIQATVATTRGPATAPVWVYGAQGSAVRLTLPAVWMWWDVPLLPGTPKPYQKPVGLARGSLTTVVLTVGISGADGTADQPCGADYAARAIESTTAVAVVVYQTRRSTDPGPCLMMARHRALTLTLRQPLGERVVLDWWSGQPVPTVRLP